MISILSKAATWSPEQPFGEAFSRVFSSRLCSAQLIWTAVIEIVEHDIVLAEGMHTHKNGSTECDAKWFEHLRTQFFERQDVSLRYLARFLEPAFHHLRKRKLLAKDFRRHPAVSHVFHGNIPTNILLDYPGEMRLDQGDHEAEGTAVPVRGHVVPDAAQVMRKRRLRVPVAPIGEWSRKLAAGGSPRPAELLQPRRRLGRLTNRWSCDG